MNHKEISIVKSLFNPEISDGLLNGIYHYLDSNDLSSLKENMNILK